MIQLSYKTHQMFNGLAAGNIGDEVMYVGFLNLLRPAIGSTVEIWDSDTCVEGWLPGCQRYIPWTQDDLCEALALQCKSVFIVGDTPVTEDLGVDWPLRALSKRLGFCHKNKIPVHAIGVGVSPLTTPEAIRIFKDSYLPIQTWSVRSEDCKKALLELGVAEQNIIVGADLGWLYTPRGDYSSWGIATLLNLGLDLKKPIIGVNVVNEVWGGASTAKEEIAEALDLVVEELSAQILFFCNETRKGEFFDSAAASHVSSAMKNKSFILPNVYYHPDQMISLLSNTSATLSQRYHFTIESVLAGSVPVSFEKGQKMKTLIDELSVPSAGTMIKTDKNNIFKLLVDAVERRNFWKLHLSTHRQQLEERAQKCADFIAATNVSSISTRPRLLLPRFDTLGDIVLVAGFILALIQRFPDADITLLVREGYQQLSPLLPSNIKWLTTPLHPYKFSPETDKVHLQAITELIGKCEWDLALFTTYNRTWIDDIVSANLVGAITVALGNAKTAWTPPHQIEESTSVKTQPRFDRYIEVDEWSPETVKYQRFWNSFFCDSLVLPPPTIQVPKQAKEKKNEFLMSLGLTDKSYFVCTPGGGLNIPLKAWSPDRFAETICSVYSTHGIVPLLVGQAAEESILLEVQQIVRQKGGPVTFKWVGADGEIDILAALIEDALFYFGNDTGPMHIAAALNVPTIGILGGGHYPRFSPTGNKSAEIAIKLPCYGCGWVCIFGDAPCIKSVQVETVIEAIDDLLFRNRLYPDKYVFDHSGDPVLSQIVESACRTNNLTHPGINRLNSAEVTSLTEIKSQLNQQEHEIERLNKTIIALQEAQKLSDAESSAALVAAREEISSLRSSLSWKITAPLRFLATHIFLRNR